MSAQIYLLIDKANTYRGVKIGFSCNVDRRRAEIPGDDVRVVHRWRAMAEEDARAIELSAHKRLACKHLAGEWFLVSVEEARHAVNECVGLYEAGIIPDWLDTPSPVTGSVRRSAENNFQGLILNVGSDFLAKFDAERVEIFSSAARPDLLRWCLAVGWEKLKAERQLGATAGK